jgi:transposase
MGFEYYRHGTLSLYAALDTATGRVHGKTAARHTSQDFITFLKGVVALCPPRQKIHIILDNLSAHKTKLVRQFLEQNHRVSFHFTPTYSSWLNQVELWFAKIERDVIARGVFTSVSDLARKLRRYINAYYAVFFLHPDSHADETPGNAEVRCACTWRGGAVLNRSGWTAPKA